MIGLLKCERGKGNMERIEEEMGDIEYHRYQHFISNSPWDHRAVVDQVASQGDAIMVQERLSQRVPTALIIDESAHLKRGSKSVGVARQYAGVVGKVDNCQVGVYVSLCTGTRSCLIDERLYLPESWSSDAPRCQAAGIPEDEQVFKTKPQLALEMIDDAQEKGIYFDWVGGDGLYGNTSEFARGLDERNMLYILDIHKDQHIYLSEPIIAIPDKVAGQRGPTPTRLKADVPSMRVDKYAAELAKAQWQKVRIRKTSKGWLKAYVHVQTVWVWDGKEPAARQQTLIIRQDIRQENKKSEIKYSLSNGLLEQYAPEEYAYFQAQRYWVERDFQNAKSELAMSDYQIRKWRAWHHHHAIVFMAMLFMLKERIAHQLEYPLMSVRDARILVTTLIARTMLQNEPDMLRQLDLMVKRHKKRQADIDRHFLRDP
jgi:SRSO17 transposase